MELNGNIPHNCELPDALDQSFDICARTYFPMGFIQLTQCSFWIQRNLSFQCNRDVAHFAEGHYLGSSTDLQWATELHSLQKKMEIMS